MDVRPQEIITEVITEKGAWLIEVETMPDHVHLLVGVDPQLGVHRLVKAIKGRSWRVSGQEFPWLKYLVAAVGGAPWSVITRYVETQRDR